MSERHMGHKLEPRTYLMVLVGLLILTIITVAVAQVDFGVFNNVIAVGVATIKATLVIMFFMHGKFENKVTWAFIFYPIILLATLIGFLFVDYGFRPKNSTTSTPISFDKQHDAHGDEHATDSHVDDHGNETEQAATEGHSEETPAGEAAHDEAEVAAADDHASDSAESETPAEVDAPVESAAVELQGDVAKGTELANQLCIACHIIDGKGNALPGAPAFEETMADPEKSTPEYLYKWLKDPQAIKAGTLMPNFALSDDKIHDLIAFLHSLEK